MKMLIERGRGRVRLQCASCGAHALMRDEDYRELLGHNAGQMRCEVCGVHAAFAPTETPDRERRVLASR